MKSATEKGTLYLLRNLLNRTNVVADPSKDFNACDDFFQLIVRSHIVVAALEKLQMSSIDTTPSEDVLNTPQELWMLPLSQRKQVLNTVCLDIIDSVVEFSFNNHTSQCDDQVFSYAQQIISLGCFYLEFCDGVKEGDGERVLRCWKYLLPIFLASGRTNYSREAVNLLYQLQYALSPRLSYEVMYTRFINVHGHQGKNIPADLHMEHLNKLAKDAIKGLRSNKTEKAIVRVGRALGTIFPVLLNFDEENNITLPSGAHNVSSCKKDLVILTGALKQSKNFQQIHGRSHSTFPRPRNVLHNKGKDETVQWVSERVSNIW